MITIYFATNRRPNRKENPTGFGKHFSADGLSNLRYGMAEVTGPTYNQFSIHVAPEDLFRDQVTGMVIEEKSRLGSRDVMAQLRQEMKKGESDTLIFIHGYNVSFRQGLSTAAHLWQNFTSHGNGRKLNLVLFSWPSDGNMTPFLAYANDRNDAAAAGPAFARAFLKVVDFLRGTDPMASCGQQLHLMAHSMGNYVLRYAVQEIKKHYYGRPPRLFDQIFMMAADEDDDAFEHEHKLQILPRLANRVSLYFNRGDVAMSTSDLTKGNPDRLGADGPRLPHAVPAKVTQIDCTPAVRGLVEHDYHVESPRVLLDMVQVLRGIPSDQIVGRMFVPETNRFRLQDLTSIAIVTTAPKLVQTS